MIDDDNVSEIAEQNDLHGNVGTRGRTGAKRRGWGASPFRGGASTKPRWKQQLRALRHHTRHGHKLKPPPKG